VLRHLLQIFVHLNAGLHLQLIKLPESGLTVHPQTNIGFHDCLCPTGALFRTEFDTVVVQQDICNGCGYCVPACPFGVIDLNAFDGKAHKCTLCYDRLKIGLEPALPYKFDPIRRITRPAPARA
jgi:Na+-translocating ferredoxin:NAD+ oxidoreductase RNF subunit RnfB